MSVCIRVNISSTAEQIYKSSCSWVLLKLVDAVYLLFLSDNNGALYVKTGCMVATLLCLRRGHSPDDVISQKCIRHSASGRAVIHWLWRYWRYYRRSKVKFWRTHQGSYTMFTCPSALCVHVRNSFLGFLPVLRELYLDGAVARTKRWHSAGVTSPREGKTKGSFVGNRATQTQDTNLTRSKTILSAVHVGVLYFPCWQFLVSW